MAKNQFEIEAMDIPELDALIAEHIEMHRANYPQWPDDGTHDTQREDEAWTLDYACQIRRDKTPSDGEGYSFWKVVGDTGQSATQDLGAWRSSDKSSGFEFYLSRFWEKTDAISAEFPDEEPPEEKPAPEVPDVELPLPPMYFNPGAPMPAMVSIERRGDSAVMKIEIKLEESYVPKGEEQ